MMVDEIMAVALGVAGGVHVLPWLARNLAKPMLPKPDRSYWDDYHDRMFDRNES
jgi:hypothetical protein